MSISHRKSRSGGSYIISMDSPGSEKKQLSSAANSSGGGGDLIIVSSRPAAGDEKRSGETGGSSRRKKRRSSKKQPLSPEGPFPKGAAEIQTFELEYNPNDESTIIGKGMYGTVYEGRCRGLRVAIKVLNDQKMDAKSLRKFKDEVELMAGINHTRVVLFLGACMLENSKVACVTEYLPNGNLETVLESKEIQLTMLDKLKYARDIALGCNWLHHSNPVIIHRDLKPSNLLLDDNGRVKVCDFGLSLAQPEHSKGFRSSRIVGTPLYTSPETIKGKTITTKADVYSYGVVLWQILTRQEPFLECEDSDEVYEVVKKGQRPPLTVPPLPPETAPALRQLVADCWQNSPRKRPTFDEILERLEVMLIEYAIPDPHGADLWKSRFLGKDEVSWPKFVSTFAEDERFGAATISPHSPPIRCLKNLLATEASPTAVVTLKSFGDFCSWFGPLIPGPHDEPINVTKKVVAILQCPWFHASVTNKQARSMLAQQPIGTFLVRYNESVRGGWIISYVADASPTSEEEGSSENYHDHRSKSRKSVGNDNMDLARSTSIGNKDDFKSGRIKHVRIYFDKNQPELGYQLLLPAKPQALKERVSGKDSSTSSPSTSSSSLNESGGETIGEAFQRYVWSSYTTYIVDFIHQLLDKDWPGREYLDIKYPCPGSRFAALFAQSTPGEESSDSVLGGSVLVRYLNSMSSMDDLKRDKVKNRITDVDPLATRDNDKTDGKETKQLENNGKEADALEVKGDRSPKTIGAEDVKKTKKKKKKKKNKEKHDKTEKTRNKSEIRRSKVLEENGIHGNEASETKKIKKEKKVKDQGNRELSKSKPEKQKEPAEVNGEPKGKPRANTLNVYEDNGNGDGASKKKEQEPEEKKKKQRGSRLFRRWSRKVDYDENVISRKGEEEVEEKDKKERKSRRKEKHREDKSAKGKDDKSEDNESEDTSSRTSKSKEKASKKDKDRGSRRLRKDTDSSTSITTSSNASPAKAAVVGASPTASPSRISTSLPKSKDKKEKKEKSSKKDKAERKERKGDHAA